jgi:sec-independent protein translocase protein TatA
VLAEIFGMDGVVVLVVVIVVFFGGSQIPKLARSLGSAHKEFKQGLNEGAHDQTTASTAPSPSSPNPSSTSALP